jgi:hypothetical protein
LEVTSKIVDFNTQPPQSEPDRDMTGARISPLAGKVVDPAQLIRPADLIGAYYSRVPDPSEPSQRIHFGTSGHRGSAFRNSFNEPHIVAIAQSLCLYRRRHGIDGPLFLGGLEIDDLVIRAGAHQEATAQAQMTAAIVSTP